MDQVEYYLQERQIDVLLFIGEQLKRIADQLEKQNTPEVSAEVARLFEQP